MISLGRRPPSIPSADAPDKVSSRYPGALGTTPESVAARTPGAQAPARAATVPAPLGGVAHALAELRSRWEDSRGADRDRLAYAGALLAAGRLDAAAAVLRVDPPPGALVRYPEAARPLDRFDPRRRCRKCGDRPARVRYVPDRLERSCRRCGWSWSEAPLILEELL